MLESEADKDNQDRRRAQQKAKRLIGQRLEVLRW